MKRTPKEIVIIMVYVLISLFLVGGSIIYLENEKKNTVDNSDIGKEDYPMAELVTSEPATGAGIRDVAAPYLRIPKKGNNAVIHLENCYMDRQMDITIDGWGQVDLTELDIVRIAGSKHYYGEYVKDGKDFVKAIEIKNNNEEPSDIGSINMLITMDHVYEPEIIEDKDYFYIVIRRPKEVFERVIVIDAGHGGSNSGTYSDASLLYEKDINLDVALKLKALLDELEQGSGERLKVYYTRLTDDNIYLSPRVKLANDVKADAFISIHCNGNYDTSLYGAEIMYPPVTGKHSPYSSVLGEICFENLLKTTRRYDREHYVREDLYILKHSRVPACLLEMGYLTHQKDRKYLENEENRQAAAEGIYRGIVEYLEWLEDAK